MSACFKSISAAILTSAALLAAPASAQDGPSVDRVIATVNGAEITLGHMLALRSGLPAQYAQIPAESLFDGLLEQLIQQTLLMQDHGDELSQRSRILLENERRAVVAGDVIQDIFDEALSDDAVQAAYEAQYTQADDETEYNASHILVETREDADALKKQLDDGAEFAALAKEHSVGPSGASGGDLGWFGPGVMVESFFESVAALEIGEISRPVQTQFGWHLIRLDDTRISEVPPLVEVRGDIEESLRQQALDSYVAELEQNGTVDRADTGDIDPAIVNQTELLEN